MNFELGGKDAAYVCEDTDLDFAVESIVIIHNKLLTYNSLLHFISFLD